MTKKLVAREVSLYYDRQQILDNIEFDIKIGEILSIIGPSGCGKSTLLNIIASIIKSYKGNISFDDIDIRNGEIICGYMPQNFGLLAWKTVKENILLVEKINPTLVDIDTLEVQSIIEELELSDLLNRYPSELSGGQRQRVALARIFISKPDILLLDEPFSSLDTFTAENSRNLFLKLWKKRKITTIFTTHNLHEAVQLGKNILILSKLPARKLHFLDNPLFEKGAERSEESFMKYALEVKKILTKERELYHI